MQFMPRCPICGSSEFLAFNGRPDARCAICRSMERSRLMFALLERTGQMRKGIEVLHFAPEFGLARRLAPLTANYVVADLETEQYTNVFPNAERIDLATDDLARFAGRFDLILHNHVLEHIPCRLDDVISRLLKCLKPDGRMYFSLPIRRNAATTEDTNFDMSPDERLKLFGQNDHVRMLGDQDAVAVLNRAKGGTITPLREEDYLSDIDLALMRIPKMSGLSGGTVFVGVRHAAAPQKKSRVAPPKHASRASRHKTNHHAERPRLRA